MSISPIPGRTTAPIPAATMLGYLAEGARTNLCLQSNAFGTTWSDFSGTCAATQNVVGPDGATSAWTLTDDNAAADEGRSQTLALTNATAYACSVFIKKTTGALTNYPAFTLYKAAYSVGAVVNTTAGTATAITSYQGATIGTTSGITVVSFNDNYWRVSFTFTANATDNWIPTLHPAFNADGTGAEAIAATGSAVFYGAQVELGSFASSYIATTTVAVTRNADILTYSGGDIPNLKTLMATFRREVGVSSLSTVVALSDGTTNEYAQSFLSNATQSGMSGADGGVVQWSQLTSNAYTPGTESTMVWSAATNDVKMAKDGVAQTADTSATMPTVTQLSVGHITNAFQLDGNVGPIYGWTRNLSQSELNAVTA